MCASRADLRASGSYGAGPAQGYAHCIDGSTLSAVPGDVNSLAPFLFEYPKQLGRYLAGTLMLLGNIVLKCERRVEDGIGGLGLQHGPRLLDRRGGAVRLRADGVHAKGVQPGGRDVRDRPGESAGAWLPKKPLGPKAPAGIAAAVAPAEQRPRTGTVANPPIASSRAARVAAGEAGPGSDTPEPLADAAAIWSVIMDHPGFLGG
jgi:hypothetical protein